MTNRTKIYRKNYKQPNFTIKTTNLVFEIFEENTIVTNVMQIVKNSNVKDDTNSLKLNGEYLKLLSIKKDNADVEYNLNDDCLTIAHIADESFILEIKTQLYPHKNSHLTGLYKSHNMFCTHCEAQGFRRITYYLDRPDVMSIFTTTIIADKDKYPTLLSNGNLISQQKTSGNKLKVVWFDPHPKPSYLFALVAGNLYHQSDTYTTKGGLKVDLRVYCEYKDKNKISYALQCLKRSMKWDEDRFGFECDLDIYMIVAVDHFNMGAMENKGLNIFNSQCVLVDYKTVNDDELIYIESIIGHEYFHNWTGNRITCRDWFQLSLKEGLTVFRDQEFTADIHSGVIKRIEDIDLLKEHQFLEDSGSMKHPVRPDFYLEIDNFYTLTVYEKGAEIFRMMHTILGEEAFMKGIKLYVSQNDGQAATVDDFVDAQSDANNYDFSQFMRWFSQAGTPHLDVKIDYTDNIYTLTIEQNPGENNKPFYIPISFGLVDEFGKDIHQEIFILKNTAQKISFKNLTKKPLLSFLRGFSAPVNFITNQDMEEYLSLVRFDNDKFNRWNSMQILWTKIFLNNDYALLTRLIEVIKIIINTEKDFAFLAKLLELPSQNFFHQKVEIINPHKIAIDLKKLKTQIANALADDFNNLYMQLDKSHSDDFSASAIQIRSLKNICLYYLSFNEKYNDLAIGQYKKSTTMTDKLSAFNIILNSSNKYKNQIKDDFYEEFKDDDAMLDKWFSKVAQAKPTTIYDIEQLLEHSKFSYLQPNRVRALLGSFSRNHTLFNSDEGYKLLERAIIKLNTINPQIGARLASSFNHWRKYEDSLANLQKQTLIRLKENKLSNNIFEIIENALK